MAKRDRHGDGAPAPTQASAAPETPDQPKLELEDLLYRLIGQAQDVMSTQGRLRGLLRANQSIVGNLTLPVLLTRIVQAACELAHARYGALGVIAPGGGLEQFVHVGFDEETVTRIGQLPAGNGLLGALIEDAQPIRLKSRSEDVRSTAFPEGHPPMTSFLGVPIRVRDEVFGNLYLTEREDGEFTAEDEELVSALAATAGVAIANARLYDDARRRQEWLQASTEVSQQLLSAEGEDPIQLIARRARQIADADLVTVVLPTADSQRLIVEVASGHAAQALTALTYPIENTLVGRALTSGQPMMIVDINENRDFAFHMDEAVPLGPVMVLPLGGSKRIRGALVIGRLRGRHHFAESELEMATTFANHAAIALELADARTDQQRLVLLEDRDRIARDLHDHVIQRLFAIGLTVQSVASGLGDDQRSGRLSRVVSDIDETIRQTRTTIFQLRGPLGPETGTVRTRLLAVVDEVSPLLGFEPQVRFVGPIDSVVPEAIVDDLVAVLREALTNSARHASAAHVDVDVSATSTQLAMEITDDGVGLSDTTRRSGLANLEHRAARHGGSFVLGNSVGNLTQPDSGGTRLRWSIPLR